MEKTETEKTKIITLEGSLIGKKSFDFGESLRVMTNDQYEQVIVDLSRVTYIDSLAIGALLYFRAILEKEQIKLLLRRPSPEIKTTIEGCHLDEIFHIIDD